MIADQQTISSATEQTSRLSRSRLGDEYVSRAVPGSSVFGP